MSNFQKIDKISLPRYSRSQAMPPEIAEVLHLPKIIIEFTKNSFQFTGAFTWNEIPQQQHKTYPLSSSLQKGNETAAEKAEMGRKSSFLTR